MQRGIDGRGIVSGKNTGLQFSNPVPALRFGQAGASCQMPLEREFIKFVIIERSKFRGQASKGPDEAKLRFDVVDDATEPKLLHELETALSFPLHINQLISCN